LHFLIPEQDEGVDSLSFGTVITNLVRALPPVPGDTEDTVSRLPGSKAEPASFMVIVQELNSAPELFLPPPQELDELTTLNAMLTATDTDLPSNTLTYHLVVPPEGVSLNPGTGVITWSFATNVVSSSATTEIIEPGLGPVEARFYRAVSP